MVEAELITTLGSMNEAMKLQSDATTVQVQALQVTLSAQQEALRGVISENSQFLAAESSRRSQGSLVDSRAVQRPNNFDGKESTWQAWSYKFSTWLSSQFHKGEDVLDTAAGCGELMIDDAKVADIVSRYPSAEAINQNLHAILISLTNQGTTAFDLVKGTKKSLGLEAWRKLSRKFDPNNPVANLRLLRKILRPNVANNENLISSIEWWEQEYSRYADRTKEVLSESMRKATLHAMCPPELANHLDLHIQRLDTYDLLKSEIERYMEQVVARTSGPTPMDIGSLHNEHKRKGKGKGHDKGNGGKNPGGKGHQAFDGDCNRCGRPGHKKTDCFAKTHKNGSALTSAPSKAPPPPKAKGGGKNGKKGNKKGKRGLHEITEGEGQGYRGTARVTLSHS